MPNLKQTSYGVDSDFQSYEEAHARAVAGAVAGAVPTFSVCGAALHKDHHIVLKGAPPRAHPLPHPLHIQGPWNLEKDAHPQRRYLHQRTTGGCLPSLRIKFIDSGTKEEIRYVKDFIDAPVLTRANYTLGSIDAPILNLLTDDGESKDDVNLPRGPLGERLAADFALGKDLTVTTLSALGEKTGTDSH
ncbi:hypothetical protein B0H13DRAFT_2310518 [Mycena leptocephala]|nr:hypothetical protein B0H13DRAFT_2310518 [Mycena leptocephala]